MADTIVNRACRCCQRELFPPNIRRGQCAFHRPLDCVQPSINDVVRDTERGCPVHDGHRPAVMSQVAIVAPVPALLGLCRPPTIIGAVGAVVVNPVDAVLRRGARPHVGIERGEVVPPLADRDAPPAIVGVCLEARITAASPHATPRAVLGRADHLVIVAALGRRVDPLPTLTAAGLGVPSSQGRPGNFPDGPAVTPALPVHAPARTGTTKRENGPSAESLAGFKSDRLELHQAHSLVSRPRMFAHRGVFALPELYPITPSGLAP